MNISNIKRQAINDANGLTLKKGKEIMLEYGMGSSSEGILARHLGKESYFPYPYDSSDLMSCIGLIRVFRIDINIMKDTNYVWNRLIKSWDMLVQLCLEGDGKTVYEILKNIREEPKTTAEIIDEVNCVIKINREEPGCETHIKIFKSKFRKDA